MAEDRNDLEQQAITYLGRGQVDKAAELYLRILRLDPRDRRARQKLAEIYLKQGKKPEAYRQFLEVAKLHTQVGQHRQALAIYQQLVRLKPNDPELQGELADSYFHSGLRAEATPHYEKAFEELSNQAPEKALAYGMQLVKLKFEDLSLRVRVASMMARAGKNDVAFGLYRETIDEYRRRGQNEDVARVARLALEVRPDSSEMLADAAEACIATDERDRALELLRLAHKGNPKDVRVLRLLATLLREGPSPEQARPVLMALAHLLRGVQDFRGEIEALEAAFLLGETGEALERQLNEAKVLEQRAHFRLFQLESADPQTQDELRLCTRAEVFLRYGFPDKAELELTRAANENPGSIPLLAWSAEISAARGATDAALGLARRLVDMVPAGERSLVRSRVRVLAGEPPELDEPVAKSPPPQDDDALIDDDEATDPGRRATPPAALSDDDLVDDELVDDEPPPMPPSTRGAPAPSLAPPEPTPDLFGDSFGSSDDLFGAAFSAEPAPAPSAPAADADEAAGLVGLGLYNDALALLRGASDIPSVVLRARCLRELGQLDAAARELRGALLDAPDDAKGLADALFEHAEVAGRQNRRRAALRSLEELRDQHQGYRESDVAARIKALRRVLGLG